MRWLLLGAVLVVGLTVAPVWAATSGVTVANVSFTPSKIEIQPGDTVTWTFAGPDTNHSVTSDPGQAESFDSDPGTTSPLHTPGDTFSHTFNTPGSYTYFCKVHTYMKGTVVVKAPGGEPPPGGGGPAPDTTAPTTGFTSVKGGHKCKRHAKHCKGKPSRVGFELSEAAHVKLTLKRSGGTSPAPVERDFPAGVQTLKFSTKKVRPGRYALTLEATDAAGNSAPPANASMRVR